MTPPDAAVTRQELEARMQAIQVAMHNEVAALRAEHKSANDHQDEEWNKGFRAMREDMNNGFDQVRQDLRSFVTNDVFVAKIGPVQAVAYGMVALLMSLMTGILAASLWVKGAAK